MVRWRGWIAFWGSRGIANDPEFLSEVLKNASSCRLARGPPATKSFCMPVCDTGFHGTESCEGLQSIAQELQACVWAFGMSVLYSFVGWFIVQKLQYSALASSTLARISPPMKRSGVNIVHPIASCMFRSISGLSRPKEPSWRQITSPKTSKSWGPHISCRDHWIWRRGIFVTCRATAENLAQHDHLQPLHQSTTILRITTFHLTGTGTQRTRRQQTESPERSHFAELQSLEPAKKDQQDHAAGEDQVIWRLATSVCSAGVSQYYDQLSEDIRSSKKFP